MPFYTLIDNKSKEEIEIMVSHNEMQAMVDTGKWTLKLSTPKFVSQVGSTMRKAGSEWHDHLDRIKKKSGKGNTVNT